MDIYTDCSLSPSVTASQLQDEAENSEVHSDNFINRVFYITVGSNTRNIYWKINTPYLQNKIQCAAQNVQGLILSVKNNNSKQLPTLQGLTPTWAETDPIQKNTQNMAV